MKDYIKSVINPDLSQNDNLNRLREYLQSYCMYILYKKRLYHNLVFSGGTALRFLYQLRRFSEDMDFCLSNRAKQYDFKKMIVDIQKEFILAGYNIEVNYDSKKAVHNALLKFSDILFETGLTPLREQKIAIKLEVDTNPPKGGVEVSDVYNSTFMFYFLHYDLPSLFAGKIHALLCRKYAKGRDWYDLLWYMTKFKNLEPNFVMLNNALAQTEEKPIKLTTLNWKEEIKKVILKLDWKKIKDDVFRFLEDPDEVRLLNTDTLLKVLSS